MVKERVAKLKMTKAPGEDNIPKRFYCSFSHLRTDYHKLIYEYENSVDKENNKKARSG